MRREAGGRCVSGPAHGGGTTEGLCSGTSRGPMSRTWWLIRRSCRGFGTRGLGRAERVHPEFLSCAFPMKVRLEGDAGQEGGGASLHRLTKASSRGPVAAPRPPPPRGCSQEPSAWVLHLL